MPLVARGTGDGHLIDIEGSPSKSIRRLIPLDDAGLEVADYSVIGQGDEDKPVGKPTFEGILRERLRGRRLEEVWILLRVKVLNLAIEGSDYLEIPRCCGPNRRVAHNHLLSSHLLGDPTKSERMSVAVEAPVTGEPSPQRPRCIRPVLVAASVRLPWPRLCTFRGRQWADSCPPLGKFSGRGWAIQLAIDRGH